MCELPLGCSTPQTCDRLGECRVTHVNYTWQKAVERNQVIAGDQPNPEVHLVPDPAFVLPTNSAERKKVPLWGGLFRYFPDALVAVARLSFWANDKHNPGQPLHWSREKSNDHEDCLLRHLMDTGSLEVDPDSGMLHEVEVAWRALAIAQLALERQRQGGKR